VGRAQGGKPETNPQGLISENGLEYFPPPSQKSFGSRGKSRGNGGKKKGLNPARPGSDRNVMPRGFSPRRPEKVVPKNACPTNDQGDPQSLQNAKTGAAVFGR